jgi:hypothetical protein
MVDHVHPLALIANYNSLGGLQIAQAITSEFNLITRTSVEGIKETLESRQA